MHRYIRFLSSASTRRTNWDPTTSLALVHPTLVLLEKCSTNDHFKQILAQVMRTNLIGQTFPMSRLILFSAITFPENLDTAISLFHNYTPCPNLYIYNTMISALSFSLSKTFSLYNLMLCSCIYPDSHTLLYLLQASKYLLHGKQIHCHAIIMGLLTHGYLQNSLLKMYLEHEELGPAHKLFEQMPTLDAVSFNIMIAGYAKMGCSLEASKLFHKMVGIGFEPDEFTMLGLLMCCGRIEDARLGKSVHAWMERRALIGYSNLILGNALLDMYVKCKEVEITHRVFNKFVKKDIISWNTMIAGYAKVGELELACSLFFQMPNRDLISWNSLIAGYAQRGDYVTVRSLFSDMIRDDINPDSVTMVNLVSAAAEIGALDEGRWVHGWLVRKKMEVGPFLGSALVDMYCKCGSVEKAFTVFQGVIKKDVTLWTTMISGLAYHGYGGHALELFSKMQKDVMPNEVTFVAVLTACSHSGLVHQGVRIFRSMKGSHCIEPRVEHYGCLVDLLGRAGRLVEAKEVIEKMPMKPSRSIWGAMLSACRAHGNVEVAEMALTELVMLEPEKEGGYVLLSNIYAACGRWSYSDKIREIMESNGVKKTAGCSSVVIDGVIHEFVAADKRHQSWMKIQSILFCLRSEMNLGANFREEFLEFLLDSC